MRQFKQSIYPELCELGGFRALKGTLDETSYNVGGTVLDIDGGIDYDITLTNTSEAVLVQGTVRATVRTECARCLEPTQIEVEGEVEGYFLFNAEEVDEGYEPDEVDAVDENGDFDLAGPLQAALVYSTPFVVYCKPDCKGLCYKCGANLNYETCSCADEPDPLNPFAALAGLSFSDEAVERGQQAALEHADDEPIHFEGPEEQLSPEEEAALEAALDAFFSEEGSGTLEFDEKGNLVFIEDDDEATS